MASEKESTSDTLFLAGLPTDTAVEELERIFRTCNGFVSCRLRRDKTNSHVGFAQFSDEISAAEAKDRYNHFDLRGYPIEVFFARSSSRKRSRDDSGLPPSHPSNNSRYSTAPHQRNPSRHMAPQMGGMMGQGLVAGDMMMGGIGLPLQLPPDACSTLYIEGIPIEAAEREIAHIFRPFPGFISVRIRLKESSRGDGGQRAMGFVEFENAYQATVAKITTNDYQVDRSNPHSGFLSVHYSKGKKPTQYHPMSGMHFDDGFDRR